MSNKRSLREHFRAIHLRFSIVPVALLIIVFAATTILGAYRLSVRRQEIVSVYVADSLERSVDTYRGVLTRVATVTNLVAEGSEESDAFLRRIVLDDPEVERLVMTDLRGREILRVEPRGEVERNPNPQWEHPQAYRALLDGEEVYAGDFYIDPDTGTPLLRISLRLDAVGRAQPGGVAILETSLRVLEGRLAELPLAPGQSAFLIDSEGLVLASSSETLPSGTDAGVRMDSVGIVAGVRARPVLRVGTMFSIEGKMYAGVVEQALFPHSLPLLAAIAFGLVVLVFVLLGVNRTRSRFEETIAVALEEMAKNASKMSAGDFDLRTPASEVSEIDRLSQSLNAMAEQTGGHIEELERRLAEREELLREVNHRVKNNLQLISSMLSLQAGRSADRHEIDFLETARNRVRAMSLVHEQLYDPEQLAEIRFDDYLRRLSREARSRWSTLTPAPEIEVRGGEVHLNLQNAIPSGLLVSELLDNSLRHAFGPERDGRIVVSAESASEATITLRVADNGRGGVPEEAENYGVGLRLVKALAQQLRGALEIQSGPGGTEVSVQFPSSPGPTRTGV